MQSASAAPGAWQGRKIPCESSAASILKQALRLGALRPASGEAAPGTRDLNPRFAIDGIGHALFPQFLAAVPRREVGPVQRSLAAGRDAITRALDLLLTGF